MEGERQREVLLADPSLSPLDLCLPRDLPFDCLLCCCDATSRCDLPLLFRLLSGAGTGGTLEERMLEMPAGVKLFWESGGGRGPGRRARTSTRAWLGEGTLAAESAPGTGVRGAA